MTWALCRAVFAGECFGAGEAKCRWRTSVSRVCAAGDEAGSRAQLAAFFTSSALFFSSAGVSYVGATCVGQMVAFVEVRLVAEHERRVPPLNIAALWEEADDLAILASAGPPR